MSDNITYEQVEELCKPPEQVFWEAYCEAVGGVCFRGTPLPTWEVMATNPEKEKQYRGFVEGANAIIQRTQQVDSACSLLMGEAIDGNDESLDKLRSIVKDGE